MISLIFFSSLLKVFLITLILVIHRLTAKSFRELLLVPINVIIQIQVIVSRTVFPDVEASEILSSAANKASLAIEDLLNYYELKELQHSFNPSTNIAVPGESHYFSFLFFLKKVFI